MADTTGWAARCIFTAAEHSGGWWLDRVNSDGRTKAAVGPYPTEVGALRAANRMNQTNQGWEPPTPNDKSQTAINWA